MHTNINCKAVEVTDIESSKVVLKSRMVARIIDGDEELKKKTRFPQ